MDGIDRKMKIFFDARFFVHTGEGEFVICNDIFTVWFISTYIERKRKKNKWETKQTEAII